MPIVGTTVATAILGAGASGTIAFGAIAAATDLALGIGLQLAANALTKKPQAVTGTSLQIQTGGVVPRSLLFGHSVTAGSLVYANVWGKANKTPNAYLTMVVALADKRIGTPTNLWINDTLCAWPDMSGTAPYAQGWPLSEFATGSNNRAWVRFYDGSQSAADSFLTSTFGADAHYPWDSTAVGAGVAYAVLTFQFDPQYFSGSIPTVKFVTPGCYWYDPRKDSTVGGSGSQAWSDETTWAPTNNPAVHLYNILRGISYGGKWMYGLQDMVAARLPLDSWFAAMNECDVAITQSDSSTLPQYQAGGEVSLDTKPADAVNALLTACAGRLSEVAGVYKLHVGAPGTAVLSFGDADIISTEAQTYTPFPSITSTINAITGKYPEPVSAWASTDAPPLYNPDYETADGNRELPQSVSYDMVPYKEQVQRLMKSALQEARRFRQATYVLPAWARRLEPGDFVSVTDTRNGFSTKLFRVDDLKYMSTLDVTVTLTEVDPSDYDWNPAADYTPVVPVPPQIVLPTAQLMTGWSAAPYTVPDAVGTGRRPAIQLSYDGDLTDVQFVRAQVRLAGATANDFDGTTPYGDPATNADPSSVIISFASILPNTQYEVRGIYVPYSSRSTLWSNETEDAGVITEGAWLAVTTPNAQFTTDDIADDAITSNKILAGAVTELQLADQAVATAKLQVAAVTADVLADQAVLTSKLADAAVASSKIADDAVVASKIAAASIGTTKFAAGITPVEIGSSLPTTGNFAGRTFFDTSGGKTYTYTNGEWTTPIFDIGPGTITGDMIANAAITASKLLDGAVTSTKIQAGAVGADQIAANSIVASKLVLTDFTNLVPDNQMVDQGSWSPGAGWSFGVGSTIGGKNYYRYVAQGNSAYGQPLNSLQFPIDATKTYFFSINYTPQSSGTVQFLFRFSWRDIGNNELSTSDIAVGPTSVGGTLSGQATPPANAQFAYAQAFAYDPGTTASLAVALPVVRVMANAELIVDGSITTSKLLAGSVTSDILAANSVVAGKIAAGAVSATQLAAGSITSDKLTVGRATNWIENSDFSAGLARWSWGGSTANFVQRLRNDGVFNVPNHPCFEIYDPNAADPSSYVDVWPLNADGTGGFACVPGQRYEVSAYINTHRCSSGIYAAFYDANNTLISQLGYQTWAATNLGGGTMAMFTRRTIFVTAPANAAKITPTFRKLGTDAGGSDSYLFMYRCQLAEATANQTEPSPWSPAGITLVTSDVIKTGAVIADAIQGGVISADKLSFPSASGNQIVNSDFNTVNYTPPITTWGPSDGATNAYGLTIGLDLPSWYPQGMGSAYLVAAGTPPVGWYGIADIQRPGADGWDYFPVTVGGNYQFSAYFSIHRCQAQVKIMWIDGSNNVISSTASAWAGDNEVGNTDLSQWTRLSAIGVAPAGATKCYLQIVMAGTGVANPYLFFTGLLYGQAAPGQTTPSDWTPAGSTAIDGAQVITNSLYASKIVANSITSDKMAANSVTAGAIAAGSVTSAAIAAGAVTADKITVANLAALGITVGSADIQDAAISSQKRFPLAYEDLLEAA